MTIFAVAWDIDGTLVDSEPLHLQALLETCKFHNVDISDLPGDEFVGVDLYRVWDALKQRFPHNLSRQQWVSALNDHYKAHADLLKPMPYAYQVVKHLARDGIAQVAVSNSNRVVVDTNLKAVGLTRYMQFSLSLDDVPEGKPSPIPYQIAVERLGMAAQKVIAIEDSATGVRSAKTAGLKVFGFPNIGTQLDEAEIILKKLPQIFDYVTPKYCHDI